MKDPTPTIRRDWRGRRSRSWGFAVPEKDGTRGREKQTDEGFLPP
jgi:hypothetical protein